MDCRSKWTVEDVQVAPKKDHYLHTLSNTTSAEGGEQQGPALVLMPGYGAGTGFFFR